MIRHTVLFTIKPETSENELKSIFQEVKQWQDTVSGVLSIVCGKCSYQEGKGIENFTDGFSIDFVDQKSLNDFFVDENTSGLKFKLVNLIVNGIDGIHGFEFSDI